MVVGTLVMGKNGKTRNPVQRTGISERQAGVIYEVAREQGYLITGTFTPREIYPDLRNRESHRNRRALARLEERGLIDLVPAGDLPGFHRDGREGLWRMMLTVKALELYDEWAGADNGHYQG